MTETPMAEHKITPRSYLLVFAALLLLTFTTLGLDLIDLGPWHAAVGLAIVLSFFRLRKTVRSDAADLLKN